MAWAIQSGLLRHSALLAKTAPRNMSEGRTCKLYGAYSSSMRLQRSSCSGVKRTGGKGETPNDCGSNSSAIVLNVPQCVVGQSTKIIHQPINLLSRPAPGVRMPCFEHVVRTVHFRDQGMAENGAEGQEPGTAGYIRLLSVYRPAATEVPFPPRPTPATPPRSARFPDSG